ncbi:hypothetical protein LOTGIDRAFT_106733 [Lottia gigantea]|uniref:Protein sleepless n=1 Tax=Lottia gigantea TaxID=225164 RepID=V4A733_LOTGI|nr:hypothetical protein LOTGIDRAFT_106733 [Lottia gigantea]ESO89086.1 hypothetical protein LOTGIDRAFT_106733 [Lottia gigantea]
MLTPHIYIVYICFSGSALKCFVCNSYHQADCADWFDNVTQHLTQCNDDEQMCRKIIQEVYYDGEWDVRYIRQCAKLGEVGGRHGRECKERVGTYDVKLRYCHCNNQDGCNGAQSYNTGLTLPLSLTMLSAVVYNVLNRV